MTDKPKNTDPRDTLGQTKVDEYGTTGRTRWGTQSSTGKDWNEGKED